MPRIGRYNAEVDVIGGDRGKDGWWNRSGGYIGRS